MGKPPKSEPSKIGNFRNRQLPDPDTSEIGTSESGNLAKPSERGTFRTRKLPKSEPSERGNCDTPVLAAARSRPSRRCVPSARCGRNANHAEARLTASRAMQRFRVQRGRTPRNMQRCREQQRTESFPTAALLGGRPPTTCNGRRATDDVQPTTDDRQRTTCNGQRTTWNGQHATDNVPQTTGNMQRTTGIGQQRANAEPRATVPRAAMGLPGYCEYLRRTPSTHAGAQARLAAAVGPRLRRRRRRPARAGGE